MTTHREHPGATERPDVLAVTPPEVQAIAASGYLANAFDMLNVRDLDLIAQARSRCTQLTLGVYTDDHAERVTDRRPIVPLSERLTLLSHVRGVDTVVVHQSVPAGSHQFVVAGELEPELSEATVLTPRRETRGQVLREALVNRRDREAVA